MQRDQGDQVGILECLAGFAALRVAEGRPRRAAVLFGAIGARRAASGTLIWPVERIEQACQRAKVRGALGADAWDAALAEGEAMTIEDAIAHGLERTERAECAPPRATPTTSGGLTAREREVVALVAQGKTNREIAAALFITERTVEAHIRNGNYPFTARRTYVRIRAWTGTRFASSILTSPTTMCAWITSYGWSIPRIPKASIAGSAKKSASITA